MSSAEENDGRGGDVWAEAVADQERTAAPVEAEHTTEPTPVAEPGAVDETGTAGAAGDGKESPFGAELPFGQELGPLVDEVRRFASAVSEKVTSLSSGAGDPMEVLQNLAAPLRSSNPAVYGHLLAAGGELIAAYRAAVSASERRWAAPKKDGTEHIDLD
ncbi:DUF5304 family protein [Streptacidiphilus jiangxiensis]|uniref:Uncharacterized protein n=1 Tax=Streptacidiphilus jiangxiensis TaxID=235985 RepID=A0A1H7SR91_STRJI|nr:DUF5304 family protein [Streptacidiphilus jiangxiensis]SEL75081.1 hypothetical protein SAMN05414137_112174 [Streptacidiphilus jiangxiensis]